MKRCESNKYLVISNISAFIYLFIRHFIKIPDVVEGFCVGICIALYPIGLYALKRDLSKVKQFKKRLIGKLGSF